jgi:GntR family transcriptional regulator
VPADTSGGGTLTERVADELRELILISAEWRNGHPLPSEDTLATGHRVSKQTVRNAIDILVGEGLIEKGQGKVSRVSIREPAYRLVIQLHRAQAGYRNDLVAEPPLSFIRSTTAQEQREWREGEVEVPRQFAAMLGLEPLVRMLAREMKLTIDGEPILTSTSYLPPDLVGDEGWRDVEIGQLALIGHEIISEYLEDEHRMPTPTERATLGMPKGVLMKIISHRCRVLLNDWTMRTGVIVLARHDRVRMRW